MRAPPLQRLRLSRGAELTFLRAGEPSRPTVLLLHVFPNSSRIFRQVAPRLCQVAHVIAPDLPGFGESDVLPKVTFNNIGEAIGELLDRLAVGPRYLYLHNFGAPVGLRTTRLPPRRI